MHLLRESRHTFWTCTIWSLEAAMKAFMHATPHGPTMRRLLEWCDEASLVHWSQDGTNLRRGTERTHGSNGTDGRRR
ncbi:MAG TPA: hypothetical protein VKI43_04460 [Vicinamibacterales bacterium]|nr:hypothetical protein [Vicinamibacterales bacterium]